MSGYTNMNNLRFALIGSVVTIWALTLVARLATGDYEAASAHLVAFVTGGIVASAFLGADLEEPEEPEDLEDDQDVG